MEHKAITYLLDDNYYCVTDKLALETEKRINREFEHIIRPFMDYSVTGQTKSRMKVPQSLSEYSLELLYIGVLFLSYSEEEKGFSLHQLENLYDWLNKTGEFNEIAERFRSWLDFWKINGRIYQEFPVIIETAKEFLDESSRMLGLYTKQVSDFIQKAGLIYKDREDYVFITRSIHEYYINMVGAQILNHIYREEFQQADKVFIFLPGCMAARMEQCKAVKSSIGYTCAGCTPDCPVYLTMQLGKEHHADTVIVYHSSELYHTKVPADGRRYGVIGIACVLNLISGGLKARELGYIPQCILLNYCGCRQHWSSEGVVTDINRDRLNYIL